MQKLFGLMAILRPYTTQAVQIEQTQSAVKTTLAEAHAY